MDTARCTTILPEVTIPLKAPLRSRIHSEETIIRRSGYNAGPAVDLLNNTTAIGYLAIPTASNQVRIGNTSVTSIGGQVEWTAFSDGRFKKDIKEDVSGLIYQ